MLSVKDKEPTGRPVKESTAESSLCLLLFSACTTATAALHHNPSIQVSMNVVSSERFGV